MTTLWCLPVRLPKRLPSFKTAQPRDDLPFELWLTIFHFLDVLALGAVCRVSRAFNICATPLYLQRLGMARADLNSGAFILPPDTGVFPALRTACSLPPARRLACDISGSTKFQIMHYLRIFISKQTHLEDVDLRLPWKDDFTEGWKEGKKNLPRQVVQKEVCRLLNSIMPRGKTVLIVPDRVILNSSTRKQAPSWRLIRRITAPPRGIRAKVRSATAVTKRQPTTMDLILRTSSCDPDGITTRSDSYALDALFTLNVRYAPAHSPGDWSIAVFDSRNIKCLDLTSTLPVLDWHKVLPHLHLPDLEELSMGKAPAYSASELHDIGADTLDAFLIRHRGIERLEYYPQPSHRSDPLHSEFCFAFLDRLTHLTITPAHFIRLHVAPYTLPALTNLILFSPTSIATIDAADEFLLVLNLLALTNKDGNGQDDGICLRFPGSWLSPPPPDLSIECISSVIIAGDFILDVDDFVGFLAPFEPGLKMLEVQPAAKRTFQHIEFVDKLRGRVRWLDGITCLRTEYVRGDVKGFAEGKAPEKADVKYDDE
ncbi:F-box domain-containing protein [Favolaschia claudopus]|uniref:F-box domain-containing protein n=1 Tax=Favolaschia claudopus TaxID=2862362 RepID=A0AAW0AXF7_9AGAR